MISDCNLYLLSRINSDRYVSDDLHRFHVFTVNVKLQTGNKGMPMENIIHSKAPDLVYII